jgi:hypothetical protein
VLKALEGAPSCGSLPELLAAGTGEWLRVCRDSVRLFDWRPGQYLTRDPILHALLSYWPLYDAFGIRCGALSGDAIYFNAAYLLLLCYAADRCGGSLSAALAGGDRAPFSSALAAFRDAVLRSRRVCGERLRAEEQHSGSDAFPVFVERGLGLSRKSLLLLDYAGRGTSANWRAAAVLHRYLGNLVNPGGSNGVPPSLQPPAEVHARLVPSREPTVGELLPRPTPLGEPQGF